MLSTDLLVAALVVLVLPTMVVEELHAYRRRAAERQQAWVRHYRGRLANAADRALAAALRAASADEPAVVTVRQVQLMAYEDFGLDAVPREHAAAMLRERLDRLDHPPCLLSDVDLPRWAGSRPPE